MRFFCLFLFVFHFIFSANVFSQQKNQEELKQPRILILLDGSSSMLQPWADEQARFKAAGRLIIRLMDSIYRVNDQVEFALRVYGHQFPAQNNNCFDTRREVMFSKKNIVQMDLRLNAIHPFGVSPIAYSLKTAAEQDLTEVERNAYSIILITDGGESCNGDICDVVKKLIENKIYFKPYILSLVDYAPLRQQYNCLGTFLTVANNTDMTSAIGTIVGAYTPMLTMPNIISKAIQVPTVITPRVRNVVNPVIQQPPVVVKRDTPPPVVKVEPAPHTPSPVILPKEYFNRLNARTYKLMFPIFYVSPQKKTLIVPFFVIKKPVVEPEPVTQPVRAVRQNPMPVAAVERPKETPFTLTVEDAAETTLQIYFTDGRGKFYATSPQLVLNDAKTGSLFQKFFRTVDAAGNPDPKKIPSGTYDIMVAGKSRIMMRNVTVVEHKNNKVTIKVSSGTLKFSYDGAPDRPITEFEAIVTKRFDPENPPTVKQRCTAELDYTPGTYYGEINTLPISKFSVDIDFGSESEVRIPQPGWVQFTNTNPIGKVSLYYPLGDRFVKFFDMNVPGQPGSQKLRLKPGTYQLRYVRNPSLPYAEETIQKFQVISTTTSDVEIH